ncbi:DUF3696 domain-containing protein [Streptomyces sp. NPDC059593]|uniref:AAA family ATPase n=1 Tax=Streptomyces sp. NPDC059593 TaxID=3346878 RepID=UPI0036B478A6
MISQLKIKNFKCFRDVTLPLRPLTVLTGVNGGGKSTVLQALLLARHASTTPDRALHLNGPFDLALGTIYDVLNRDATESVIEVGFFSDQTGEDWSFRFDVPDDPDALYLTCAEVPDSTVPGIGVAEGGFTYLCAERLGPRDVLSLSPQEPERIQVGVHGEFTAQVLAMVSGPRVSGPRREVREPLRHPSVDVVSPLKHIEAWASQIIRPVAIEARVAPGTLASTIRFEESDRERHVIRPSNTGFGVSYALPIVVAGVLASPGDMLLVENPEAHLHPAGQSRLGRFLAQVAGSGVHVVVETHSDHVLNGARLAVAQDQSLVAQDMVVHYFDETGAQTVQVSDHGELDRWPAGFFDQIETDLGGLAHARRHR